MRRGEAAARLRVGLLLGDEWLDARACGVIALLRASAEIRIEWVGLLAEDELDLETRSIPRTLRLLIWADRRVRSAAAEPDTLERLVDVLPDFPLLAPDRWQRGWGSDCDSEFDDHPEYATTRPDLLVVLAPCSSAASLAHRSGVEVWWFESDGGHTATLLEGFEPVSRGEPLSRVRLLAADPERNVRMLGLAEYRTHPGSPTMNGGLLRYGGIRLFDDALKRMVAYGTDRPWPDADPERGCREGDDRVDSGAVRQAFPLLGRALATAVRSRLGDRSDDVQWSVGLADAGAVRWDRGQLGPMSWLEPPDDVFYADPFLVQRGGDTWLFMEVLRYADRKGFIAAVNASDRDSWTSPVPVLERPFHLSFPCIIEHGGDVFMLPEQVQSGELVLYRSDRFPEGWRPHATLLTNVEAADPVLLRYGGLWWLFYSSAQHGSHDNNLQLYYSERLEGPYTRHPKSPVREALLGSRMAGQFFVDAGRLIRPAQDCRADYGNALAFFEVNALTPDDYREEQLALLTANRAVEFGLGTHSYSRTPSLVAVDGFRYRRHRGRSFKAR
jgi:hypothetical protein